MNEKQIACPISVSDCNHICVDGRIKAWTVAVEYKGDLSVNSKVAKDSHGLFVDEPMQFRRNTFKYNFLAPVLNQNIIIPEMTLCVGDYGFEYDDKRDVSVIEYRWKNKSFSFALERANRFRLRVLSRMNQKTK